MRPTIEEQLRDTRRILSDVVKAQVSDGYSTQIATMALANLEMLETAWGKVLPFLTWDNDSALTLLQSLQGELDSDLGQAIDALAKAPLADAFDVVAMQQRNEAIQQLMVRAIAQCGAEGRRRIHALLLERTARYPMRPLPASRPNISKKKED